MDKLSSVTYPQLASYKTVEFEAGYHHGVRPGAAHLVFVFQESLTLRKAVEDSPAIPSLAQC